MGKKKNRKNGKFVKKPDDCSIKNNRDLFFQPRIPAELNEEVAPEPIPTLPMDHFSDPLVTSAEVESDEFEALIPVTHEPENTEQEDISQEVAQYKKENRCSIL